MKPRIVITGVAGFIGSNLADQLVQQGYQVIGIDNLRYGVREQVPAAVEFHTLDVTSPEIAKLFQKDDVVFHLAAKNCISDCQLDPLQTCFDNVYGTVQVFDAAVKKSVAKVIYAESSALYEGSKVLPTPETEVHPESFYSLSKLSAMLFAQGYERYYGLKTTALRYFCVYGPRQDYRRTIPPVMSAFIIKLLRNETPVIYGSGEKRRDFIHIDDVNRFHLQCIEDARTNGRCFNLCSGKNYSVNEIYAKICRLVGVNLKPTYQPDLPGEAQETLADIRHAGLIGWQPKVSLEQGLQQFIDYYRDTGIPWKISTH